MLRCFALEVAQCRVQYQMLRVTETDVRFVYIKPLASDLSQVSRKQGSVRLAALSSDA